MATVIRNDLQVVYGVLHMVTEDEKRRLDTTESSYEALETKVETRASAADGSLTSLSHPLSLAPNL